MAKQTYYEDVEEGAEIPSLEKTPTTTTLVKWVWRRPLQQQH
jgi:hypothetical protein